MNEWYDCEYKSTPKVGETVYIVYEGEIYKSKIYAVGENFFIPTDYRNYKAILSEIKFNDYGKKWFYQLSTAKEKVLESLTDEQEIIQGDDDWWYTSKI
jgi:hypothetical protein